MGAGGNAGWAQVADGVILFPAQEKNHVGLTQEAGSPVQTPLEEAEAVGVVVGHQAPGVVLGKEGQVCGLYEPAQHIARVSARVCISCRATRDGEGPLGPLKQPDGLAHQLGCPLRAPAGPVFLGSVEGDIRLGNLLLLHVHGNGEVNGAPAPAVGRAHGPGYIVRYTPGVGDHPRPLGHRGRHGDLLDLLHGPPSQVGQLGGAADGDHRALAVQGMGQAGDGVGKARRGVHADAGPPCYPPPGVGHVDGCLLVTGVQEAEVHVVQDVQGGQDVVAGQGEDVGDPLLLQGPPDEMAARDLPRCGHRALLGY